MDRATSLITRLLEHRDPSFDPPPFSASLAEEVLGPSGRPLTPHRRLLELCNGAYLFDHALHLFGACENPAWHSLRAWNATTTWRDAYGAATDGLCFFAEDAFGDQFAYNDHGGAVVIFGAELGRVEPCAPSFLDWLETMLEHGPALLPIEYLDAERRQGKRLQPSTQLVAFPPLFSVEARAGEVEVGHVDAAEAMRYRGQLASKLRDLPEGTRIELQIDD